MIYFGMKLQYPRPMEHSMGMQSNHGNSFNPCAVHIMQKKILILSESFIFGWGKTDMFANLFYTCKEFRIAIHVLQNQQLRNNHKSKRILMKCFLKKINASVWVIYRLGKLWISFNGIMCPLLSKCKLNWYW